jgi:alkylresorcinol/alkylpyrone synthase
MTPSGAALRQPAALPSIDRTRPRRERAQARIAGLQVCDGEASYTQEEVLARLGLLGDASAEGVFARCGVRRRHLNLDADFLARTLQGRSAQVEEELFARAVGAVDALALDVREVGTLVTSSLYALGCPTLAHRLVEHYRMDPATDKYHVAGVGCASAVPLMRLAAQSLAHHPGRPALVVAAESMSSILMPATPADPKAKTVGSAIFGDGCAAALLGSEERASGPAIVDTRVHQLPDSLGAVSLALAPQDSYLQLSRELPEIAAQGLAAVVDGFLAEHRMDRSRIDHWIVHPGGRRVIEGIQQALALAHDQVQTSWQALAEHGNVGTPSILYVLRAVCEQHAPERGERGLAVTIGPGVTIGLMLLRW